MPKIDPAKARRKARMGVHKRVPCASKEELLKESAYENVVRELSCLVLVTEETMPQDELMPQGEPMPLVGSSMGLTSDSSSSTSSSSNQQRIAVAAAAAAAKAAAAEKC